MANSPTTISASRLATLAGVHRAQVCRKREALPPVLSVEALAEWMLDQTAELSDIECRLRVALSRTERQP